MVFPQRLDLGAEVVALGDDLRVGVSTDDAMRESRTTDSAHPPSVQRTVPRE